MRLRAADLAAERHSEASGDVHFPRALAQAVIVHYSSPGDTVLDPFAGWGTTLVVAEQLGRSAVGVELLPERSAAIRQQVGPSTVVHTADARDLEALDLGAIDLCFTSPPYMTALGHPENPLSGYSTLDGDYPTYLRELTATFVAVADLLGSGGHIVVNAANIRTGRGVTTLAWDITRALSPHLPFLGETYLDWDEPPAPYTGDYCLAFRKS